MFHFDNTPAADRRSIKGVVSDREFIEEEIRRFKCGPARREMLDGERYYDGQHDILSKRRMVAGEGGEPLELKNLPNNRVVDNQYRRMVNQKANYLLGRPVDFQADNMDYAAVCLDFFDAGRRRMLLRAAKKCLNQGIVWIYPGYDGAGNFTLRCFDGYEIIPGWRDKQHSTLDYAIRIYEQISYEGERMALVEHAEVFAPEGIYFFLVEDGCLKPEKPYFRPYLTVNGRPARWERIPLVAFRRDERETPLIRGIKSLQDGLNAVTSAFQNGMEEDCRNTIMVLVNYDGENLAEFRQKLAAYGAVKVRTVDGAPGDVKSLKVEVNAENYRAIINIFRRAIIENAMGYDAKDERLLGSPNQMKIKSMYADIDLDANDMECEFQVGFEELLWFINRYFIHAGMGDFTSERLKVIFNRDTIVSESDVIDNLVKSKGLLSEETLVAMHPWVQDWQLEMERLRRENKEGKEV